MKFTRYNPNASRNYAFHLHVINGISEKRAEEIATSENKWMALVNGHNGPDLYNSKSLDTLSEVSGVTEEIAKRYIDAYAKSPFEDINWKVKEQLEEANNQNHFNLTQNSIYKIAKAVDDLSNPWIAYRMHALSYDMTAVVYQMFTDDDEEIRKKTLAVWNAEHQLAENEQNNLITIRKSDYILDEHALDDFGVITPFMDGWARTDTLRDYKIVEDTLRDNVGVTVGHNENELNYEGLFPDQVAAIEKIIAQPISFLTGYAGTGKTYVIKKVLEALGYNHSTNDNYAVATAIAGKAVKNFKESVDGIDIETSTIAGVRYVETFRHLFANANTIVVDEFSMISLHDLAFLFKLNPEARYIFIGDSNQLPAIGLDVLKRLEDEELLVPIKLTIPKRQGSDSGIFKDSMSIVNGDIPEFNLPDSTVHYNSIDHEYTVEEIIEENPNADVFLVAQNEVRKTINRIKHAEVLANAKHVLDFDGNQQFAEGDKIIVGKNNPDTDLMNGDLLDVVYHNESFWLKEKNGKEIKFLESTFDWQAHKADLGFAITIHKSQGSTIDNVVTILGYTRLQSRNILYTALTRAKEHHALYIPDEERLKKFLDTEIDYQHIDINQLDLAILTENEEVEKMNGYVR